MSGPAPGAEWDPETARLGPDPEETVRQGPGNEGTVPLRPDPQETVRYGGSSQPAQPLAPAPGQTRRFGPGVTATPATPAWSAATSSARPPRRRRGRVVLSTLVTLAIAAGVFGYLWWSQQDPLEVTGATVAPAEPPGDQCDITVDVVGTIHTSGSGTVVYQWIRSDGETSAVLSETVPTGADSVQVHLFWQFSGEGSYDATATLQVLEPTATEASADFTYQCGPGG